MDALPDVTVFTVRKDFKKDGSAVLALRLRLPSLVYDGGDEAVRAFCGRFSRFYRLAGERLEKRAKRDLARASACFERTGKPAAIAASTAVGCQDGGAISLAVDVAVFNGAQSRPVRFAQTWSLAAGGLLEPAQFLDVSRRSRAHLIDCVRKSAAACRDTGKVLFYPDLDRRLKRYFRFENVCFAPKGLSVFYPAGTLDADTAAIRAFCVPYAAVDGILKLKF